ncbi:hypothetical protein LguiB_002169 [Lonicera macranthoides]
MGGERIMMRNGNLNFPLDGYTTESVFPPIFNHPQLRSVLTSSLFSSLISYSESVRLPPPPHILDDKRLILIIIVRVLVLKFPYLELIGNGEAATPSSIESGNAVCRRAKPYDDGT